MRDGLIAIAPHGSARDGFWSTRSASWHDRHSQPLRDPGARLPIRTLAAFLLFYVFGWIWADLIGDFRPRQQIAFWPTLFLFGYAVAGLWFGPAFTAIGLGLTGLIVAGYFWSGADFTLWMAVVTGGGFILCGLWMRRA